MSASLPRTPGVTTAADFDVLIKADKPYLYVAPITENEATGMARSTRARAPESALVTVLRGRKMVTEQGLYDEFGAALQFPFFGENWDALNDCLGDLSWLPAPGHVLVITSAPLLLTDAVDRALPVFVRLLERVAGRWAEPNPPLRDRADVPFHVLFQAPADDAAALLVRCVRPAATLASWKPSPADDLPSGSSCERGEPGVVRVVRGPTLVGRPDRQRRQVGGSTLSTPVPPKAHRSLPRRLALGLIASVATMVVFVIVGLAALGPVEALVVVMAGIAVGWASGRTGHRP